ncbi:MAG: DUF6512 family protein [Promethearchaeota archaeon]
MKVTDTNIDVHRKNKVLLWEVVGIFFVSILGAMFHFVFEWLGHWEPIGGFFPVNESVWEHLKLPFWPLLIFGLIEYNFIKEESENLLIGKAVAALISIATILIVFYSYTTIFGIELLVVDILSFIAGVVIGQLVSYKILIKSKMPKIFSYISWIFIVTLGLIFFLFTYIPPQIPIFQDSETGLYGILNNI